MIRIVHAGQQHQKPAVRTELKPSVNPQADRDALPKVQGRTPAKSTSPKIYQTPLGGFDDDIPEQRRRGPIASSTVASQPVRTLRLDRDFLDEPRVMARTSPLADVSVALDRAEQLHQPRFEPTSNLPFYDNFQRRPWLMLIVIVVCVAVVVFMLATPQKNTVGIFRDPAASNMKGPVVAEAPAPNGEHSIVRAPTLTASQIDHVLESYGSPAAGTGSDWVSLGQKYGIDPAYALAFFVVESTAGTAQGWAGWKEDGSSTHNIGNIICAGYATCHGRFRDYTSWQEGIEDWYKLIAVEYVEGRQVQTIEQIIPIYAPSFENDVPAYVNNVEQMVAKWRAGGGK